MQLRSPDIAPKLTLPDAHGQPIIIGGPRAKRTLLSFFRDPACPFCNFRIYQLTSRHPQLASHGLEVIALFSATADEVKRFVAQHPRPFPVIADPTSAAYDAYRVEHSRWAKFKAIITRLPTLLKGLRWVGWAGFKTNNVVPADFLIDEDGTIVEAYYGRDAGDHIPFERVELFAARAVLRSNRVAA
ncbi:MAG TPA: peroxiredoxin-like family protein [Rhodanobacteraceae bacterium]